MTVWIGPVEVEVYDPVFNWGAAPAADGAREASIDGRVVWSAAQQLSELINNPHRRVTIGRAVGVLEYLWASDDMRRPFRGWHLLSNFEISGSYEDSLEGISGIVPVSFSAVLLGDQRAVVVTRSARARANDFDLDSTAVVANPFWGDDPDGDVALADPGGTFITREYDPTSPHTPDQLTPADGARDLGMYVGTVDELAAVVLPDLEAATDYDGQSVPRWITDRGGDCRAYDRREEREVFGPSHPLTAPTDLVITNGIVRAWVGSRGLVPYLQVQAMAGGSWQEVGYLHLADHDQGVVLNSVRLVRVTPDVITVAIGFQGQGEATVTLHRGARTIRIQHGSQRSPAAAGRRVRWAGLPPWTRLVSGAQGDGRFGKGIDAGRDPATWDDPVAVWDDPNYSWDGLWPSPDLRLAWPPAVLKTAWTHCWWYRPAKDAVDLDGAGLESIFADDEALVGRLLLDAADDRFKFTLGATTIQSAAQTFLADTDVFVCMRFSVDDGMALSVKAGASAIAHVKNAAADDPGADGSYMDIFFGTSDSTWEEGDYPTFNWADGVMDNGMLFDGYLSDVEVEALAAAASRLDGLPTPEARLVWHCPGDPRLIPKRSALTTGRVFEATATDGATRSADANGLTKALAVLVDEPVALDDLAVAVYGETLEVAAYLATTATGDDLADHHEQFAAASTQETRVR